MRRFEEIEEIEDISSDDSGELPWPIPQAGLLSVSHQQLLAPSESHPVTPPSLQSNLFLSATPSPPGRGAGSSLPDFVASPVAASTSSHRSLDSTWQSNMPWYDNQPSSSTIASGSSLAVRGAFLHLPSSSTEEEEEVDIWADAYKVAYSDDHTP